MVFKNGFNVEANCGKSPCDAGHLQVGENCVNCRYTFTVPLLKTMKKALSSTDFPSG